MTHAEFVRAYGAGEVRVNIDRAAAGIFVSRRLLLPLVRLPVLGLGVGLALVGWLWTGFIVIAIATLMPMLVRRSAPHFVLTEALKDSRFYEEAVNAGVFEILDGAQAAHATHPRAGPHQRASERGSPARQARGRE